MAKPLLPHREKILREGEGKVTNIVMLANGGDKENARNSAKFNI
jgi:hypothetical protein